MQTLKGINQPQDKNSPTNTIGTETRFKLEPISVENDMLSTTVYHNFSHFGTNGVIWIVNEKFTLLKWYMNIISYDKKTTKELVKNYVISTVKKTFRFCSFFSRRLFP